MSNLYLQPVVVVDVETTGLDPRRHVVIEVAAKRWPSYSSLLVGEEPERAMHMYFLPTAEQLAEASVKALQVNRFDLEQWRRDAYPKHQGLEILSTFLEGARFIAWNAAFDRGFLRAELERTGLDPDVIHYRTLDPQALAFGLFGGRLRSSSLERVCEAFGISNEGAHRADVDVDRTVAFLRVAHAHLERRAAGDHAFANVLRSVANMQRNGADVDTLCATALKATIANGENVSEVEERLEAQLGRLRRLDKREEAPDA